MKSRQSDLVKLEIWNGKTVSTPRKIDAILLNIRINRPKLVDMCGYMAFTRWRSGGAIWWLLTGWRPGVVDWGRWCVRSVRWLLTAVQLFVSTCSGLPHLALQHHWLLPINCHFDDCKARLVRFPRKRRYIRITGFSFNFINWQQIGKFHGNILSLSENIA